MAIAFPRSLRTLSNDRFRPSLLSLVVTSCLLLAWLGWFFFAQIPIYESSSTFEGGRNGSLTVTFPAETLARLAPGQKATLQVDASNRASTTYNGEVLRVNKSTNTSPSGNGTAEIYFQELLPLSGTPSGTVQVRVETVSPAALVLQAARQSAGSLKTTPTPKPNTPAP